MYLVELMRVCVDDMYLYDSEYNEIGMLHKSKDHYPSNYRGQSFNEQKYLRRKIEEVDICDDGLVVYLK